MDSPTDTHRHLSHLIGLYPGYALASYNSTLQPSFLPSGAPAQYSKSQVIDAATTSLIHRGNGTGPDADSGWEKVWRAAAWAQLQNATTFYHELSVGPHNLAHFTLSHSFCIVCLVRELRGEFLQFIQCLSGVSLPDRC